ncbi:flagellar hook assembly protein FlgD [Thiobacter aerophilum]|uniref:Basal-body rod modification protein FlgD n=1 Tax=Thiobacter aerophilum TaxID=3121275 RepID=A0ABV0EJ73_9BURK
MTTAVSPVTASSSQTARSADAVAASEDRFLKLLVAQMKNQDPLNPLDNAQVTSQMAQLSTVTGINKLADLVQSIAGALTQAQSLQAAGMIGRGVLTEGSTLLLRDGVGLAGFELSAPADQVLVVIKDAAGQLVHSANLGAQPAGVNVFQWDGVRDDGQPAASGTYRFEVKARANGQVVTVTPLSHGTVASVSLNRGQVELNLLDLGAVTLSQIKQVM